MKGGVQLGPGQARTSSRAASWGKARAGHAQAKSCKQQGHRPPTGRNSAEAASGANCWPALGACAGGCSGCIAHTRPGSNWLPPAACCSGIRWLGPPPLPPVSPPAGGTRAAVPCRGRARAGGGEAGERHCSGTFCSGRLAAQRSSVHVPSKAGLAKPKQQERRAAPASSRAKLLMADAATDRCRLRLWHIKRPCASAVSAQVVAPPSPPLQAGEARGRGRVGLAALQSSTTAGAAGSQAAGLSSGRGHTGGQRTRRAARRR